MLSGIPVYQQHSRRITRIMNEERSTVQVEPLEKGVTARATALSRQIYDRIRQMIREGSLRAGDILPSERELAQRFDVSRVPVREALKVLEFVGVTEHIQGKGIFVRRVTAESLASTIDFVLMNSPRTLLDLFEAREGIEIQAASLAAQRRDDADLARMEAAILATERSLTEGVEIIDSSMGFHTALIAASHNKAIVEINLFLSEWLRYARLQFMRSSRLHDEGLHRHREIFEMVKLKDSAGAAAKMREHLETTKQVLLTGDPPSGEAPPDEVHQREVEASS